MTAPALTLAEMDSIPIVRRHTTRDDAQGVDSRIQAGADDPLVIHPDRRGPSAGTCPCGSTRLCDDAEGGRVRVVDAVGPRWETRPVRYRLRCGGCGRSTEWSPQRWTARALWAAGRAA